MKRRRRWQAAALALLLLSACAGQAKTHGAPQEPAAFSKTLSAQPARPSARVDNPYRRLVTVDKGYRVAQSAGYRGQTYQYAVFALKDALPDGDKLPYWEVVVHKGGQVVTVIRQEREDYAGPLPELENLVVEIDADFDGQNDILVCQGHFGNQGLVRYTCYLQREDGFVREPSFSEIANPAVDGENQVILSSWRNWAASHSYAVYRWMDGKLVETERLTEEPVKGREGQNGEDLWGWTDEALIDGQWRVREFFTEEDYDKETLYRDKVYGKRAYWDIAQDRWRTLYNSGLMADFSIYSEP